MSAVCAATLGLHLMMMMICPAFTSADGQTCDYHTMVGGSVAVVPSPPWDRSLRLRWTHGSTTVHDTRTSAAQKRSINAEGSLLLTDVTTEDGGQYQSEVFQGGTSKGKTTFRVCIIDKLPKPEVKVKCSTSSVTFTCIINKVHGVTFQWTEGGQILEDQTNATLVRRSSQLGGNSFSCRVSLSVFSETSSPVKQNCLKPDVPVPSSDKHKLLGLDFWLMVGILAGGGGLVLLLIVVTIVCCTKARRRKQMQGEEEQELRLGWSNTQQQEQQQQQQHPRHHHPHPQHHHHQHQHHHQQQQPAGHTGPRQPRPKQPRPRAPEHGNGHPQPSPRRPAQTSRPAVTVDDEKPPPLPQPRKKTPRM